MNGFNESTLLLMNTNKVNATSINLYKQINFYHFKFNPDKHDDVANRVHGFCLTNVVRLDRRLKKKEK